MHNVFDQILGKRDVYTYTECGGFPKLRSKDEKIEEGEKNSSPFSYVHCSPGTVLKFIKNLRLNIF